MHFKIVVWPFVAGVIAYFLSAHCKFHLQFNGASDISSFGGSVSSIATTMLGFMLAVLSVLASIENTPLVKIMKQTGHYKNLLITLFFGCTLQFLCLLIGFWFLVFSVFNEEIFYVFIGVEIAAVISLLDIGRKFWLVLSNLNDN